MRCGILLRAPEGQCRITDLSIPELDSRYLALTGNDIPGNNTFSFLSGNMPIIAKETLSYPGQIVLALFAPDYESASLMMRPSLLMSLTVWSTAGERDRKRKADTRK